MTNQKLIEKSLDKFKSLYDSLDRNTLSRDLLAEVYSEDIVFEDSLHKVEGLDALYDYFVKMYENVQSIQFEWQDTALNESGGFIRWVMTFRHPRLKKGMGIEVVGVSFLKSRDGKIVEHRDFFDAGEMLYEQVPAPGAVIRTLKKRVA